MTLLEGNFFMLNQAPHRVGIWGNWRYSPSYS